MASEALGVARRGGARPLAAPRPSPFDIDGPDAAEPHAANYENCETKPISRPEPPAPPAAAALESEAATHRSRPPHPVCCAGEMPRRRAKGAAEGVSVELGTAAVVLRLHQRPKQVLCENRQSSPPIVSVVIPTYDRPAYLRLALASALKQTHRHLEIIVHDNASRQDPSPIVAEFADPRVRFYRNARTIGQTSNILAAVAKATGKYVAILGDDDVWQSDFIAALVAPMEADPQIVVAFCDHDIIDADGRLDAEQTEEVTRRFGRHAISDGAHRPFDDVALLYRAICVVSGAVIRADGIDWSQVPPELPSCSDIFISYLLAASGGRCWYTSRRLMQYRYHAGQVMRQQGARRTYAPWTLELWLTFLRDARLGHRSYYRMVCTRWAVIIVLDRLRQNDWKVALSKGREFFAMGIFDPRVLIYHLFYTVRFRASGIKRLMP
jgi:glycosyltransferase involved in cell wall biosynthesis